MTEQLTSLADQLRERIRTSKVGKVVERIDFGPFGTGEKRADYEHRIMNTPDAWTSTRHREDILPR